MLDFMHLPPGARGDVKIYTPTTTYGNGSAPLYQSYTAWHKPRGVTMVSFTCIASGGGGGAGFTGLTNTARGGGGGGACSGIARFICPAMFLPDVLYVVVPSGGIGGNASGTAGGNGANSYVTITRPVSGGVHTIPLTPNMVCYSGVNVPVGGGAGANTGAAAGGTIPSIATTLSPNTWGQWFATVGIAGGAGGNVSGAAVTNITAWAALPMSPGAGGGGLVVTTSVAVTGGDQRATALVDMGNQGYYTTAANGVARAGTGTGAAIDGSSGVKRLTPFFNSGGAGGGSIDTGVGGSGGNGGYGCGGGGGGAGTTGGRGGNGGDGLVVIVSW
jgi:hypothetical protein